jgi:TRAP-type mannitol/chloroaromatic compound transport system permease large subunit
MSWIAATGMVFGWIAVELSLVPAQFFAALPLRLYGIMSNDVLLAIPFSPSWG